MGLSSALAPVLDAAGKNAVDVDKNGRFPSEAVDALRGSGLLGLTLPKGVGGMGGGPEDLVEVITQIAAACGSTAMVYLMHVSSAMVVGAAPPPGQPDLPGRLATGELLGTLAFSERGSRSHFWAPVSQAQVADNGIALEAGKSWVTSAGYADVYVVSTQTPAAHTDNPGPMTTDLYAVAATDPGVSVSGTFRGLGLRGNASTPMMFELVTPETNRIGDSGGGFALMLEVVMPWFNLGNASVSLGLAQASVDAAVTHTSGAKLQHIDQALAQLPTIRAQLARMSLELEATRAYTQAAARSIAAPDDTTTLRVLGVKALANDAALRITDSAMRVCGGAAFSEHLQVERYFRDARAGHVMAPTADVLYDFYGKAVAGLPLF